MRGITAAMRTSGLVCVAGVAAGVVVVLAAAAAGRQADSSAAFGAHARPIAATPAVRCRSDSVATSLAVAAAIVTVVVVCCLLFAFRCLQLEGDDGGVHRRLSQYQ